MKHVLPMTGYTVPPTVSNKGASNCKGAKNKTPQEMEQMAAHHDKPPPKKNKATTSKPKSLDSADLFQAAVAGVDTEVGRLFLKYADTLSERAALDASQVRELEGMLKEARSLEFYLREKKDHLKHTLALISEQL